MTSARVVGSLVAILVAACSGALDVKDPDVINPGDVNNPDGAVAAYNGGIGDFAFANDGDFGVNEGQILVSGVMSDEYSDVETFPTRIEYDSRSINEQNATLATVFFNLQKARVALQDATKALQHYAPDSARIGEMFALTGFTYVYFGENYCSGVPFSERQPDGSIQYGQPLSTDSILDRAIARFDSAAGATTDPGIFSLAAVGKGRALLDKGDYAAAVVAVGGVPTGFLYQTAHSISSARQFNGVYVFNAQAPGGTARFSVAETEGLVGLNFRDAGDARVVAPADGFGFDGADTLYVLAKCNGDDSPVDVAGGVEARLIEAEGQLQAGNGAAMIGSLNALRADAANNGGFSLAALADPGTQAGRKDLLFRERAFWLFGTGHRLGDLRRLVRQYGRSINAVYPNGTYVKTGTAYGNNTELPVPFDERNNPNYTGCNYSAP